MKRAWRISLAVLIMLSCVGCDRVAKHIARQALAGSSPILLLNGWVRLVYSENQGAFLGIGSSWPTPVRLLVLTVLAGAGLAAILWYIATADGLSPLPLVGLSLLVGGGVGNLVDRILHDGAVVDFVRLGQGALRTGIFNLADVAILAGALLVGLGTLTAREGAVEEARPDA